MADMVTASGTEGTIAEDNLLVWNQGKNPLVNFNFMLRVEAIFDLPCRKIHAFSREMEYEYYQEGGLNDYVHMLRKPISRPFTLEIERYVGVDYIDPLPLGAELALPVLLFVGRNPNQFIPFVTARTYVFTGCCVMKKEYGELNAENSGILTEVITLGYREMLVVDIPWSANVSDVGTTRQFDPNKSTISEENTNTTIDDTEKIEPLPVPPNPDDHKDLTDGESDEDTEEEEPAEEEESTDEEESTEGDEPAEDGESTNEEESAEDDKSTEEEEPAEGDESTEDNEPTEDGESTEGEEPAEEEEPADSDSDAEQPVNKPDDDIVIVEPIDPSDIKPVQDTDIPDGDKTDDEKFISVPDVDPNDFETEEKPYINITPIT